MHVKMKQDARPPDDGVMCLITVHPNNGAGYSVEDVRFEDGVKLCISGRSFQRKGREWAVLWWGPLGSRVLCLAHT